MTEPRDCCKNHWSEDANARTAVDISLIPWQPFIVCRLCGNKRCPKATDCSLECTNSNNPGQAGSDY